MCFGVAIKEKGIQKRDTTPAIVHGAPPFFIPFDLDVYRV